MPGEHVVTADVSRIVAGNEVRRRDRVFAGDRLVAETQVRNRDAAGLLRVVDEVGRTYLLVWSPMILTEFLFEPTVPSPPRPQNMQAVVPAGSVTISSSIGSERPGHVVIDADGEIVGVLAVHVLVDRIDHRRGELFAGQSVTTADNGDILPGRERP